MPGPDKTYLMIGCGIFTLSTALHLKSRYSSSSARLLDLAPAACPSAASRDLNKILRADYDQILHMRLALEAMEAWRNDPVFSTFYHQSGILISDHTGWEKKCLENYNALHLDVHAGMLETKEAVRRFDIFRDTDRDGRSSAIRTRQRAEQMLIGH